MNQAIADLWSRTSLLVWPEELVLASLPVSALPALANTLSSHLSGFSAVVVERDEVSVTVADAAWSQIATVVDVHSVAGPFRAITFDLALDLDVCGYLLPAAERLAAAGISIVPQCAYQKDHVLVAATQLAEAVQVLEGLVADARAIVAAARELA